MQLAKLDYPLGAVVIMNSFPLPPLIDMPGNSLADARKNATYFGQDMRFMIWYGEADTIFPPPKTKKAYHDIFDVLEIRDTLKIEHIEEGMDHKYIEKEFAQMIDFINGNDDAQIPHGF